MHLTFRGSPSGLPFEEIPDHCRPVWFFSGRAQYQVTNLRHPHIRLRQRVSTAVDSHEFDFREAVPPDFLLDTKATAYVRLVLHWRARQAIEIREVLARRHPREDLSSGE